MSYARLMRKLGASRRAFFEALHRLAPEGAAGRALPVRRMEEVPDYHVDLHGHRAARAYPARCGRRA